MLRFREGPDGFTERKLHNRKQISDVFLISQLSTLALGLSVPFIWASVQHLVSILLRGRGELKKLITLLIGIYLPLWLVSLIVYQIGYRFIDLLFGFYIFVLTYLAVRAVYGFNISRGILSTTLGSLASTIILVPILLIAGRLY
jgi:hypothetical protein